MIAIHPLLGVCALRSRPGDGAGFVMASRHRAGAERGLARPRRRQPWRATSPGAEQAVGRPDVSGRGHLKNLEFWRALADRGAVIG